MQSSVLVPKFILWLRTWSAKSLSGLVGCRPLGWSTGNFLRQCWSPANLFQHFHETFRSCFCHWLPQRKQWLQTRSTNSRPLHCGNNQIAKKNKGKPETYWKHEYCNSDYHDCYYCNCCLNIFMSSYMFTLLKLMTSSTNLLSKSYIGSYCGTHIMKHSRLILWELSIIRQDLNHCPDELRVVI